MEDRERFSRISLQVLREDGGPVTRERGPVTRKREAVTQVRGAITRAQGEITRARSRDVRKKYPPLPYGKAGTQGL